MNAMKKSGLFMLAFGAMGAQAGTVIDFVEMAEVSKGESAYNSLVTSVVTITAHKGSNEAFGYLDNTHAGLGVCGALLSGKTTGEDPGNAANKCNPSSDDNITGGAGNDEKLTFVFNSDVVIDKIWLNNTHDPDFEIVAPDMVLINGTSVNGPGNGYAPTPYSDKYNTDDNNLLSLDLMASAGHFLGGYNVKKGEEFTIAFYNQQFYVSGMEVRVVPIPGALMLFVSGLLGLAGIARRSNHA